MGVSINVVIEKCYLTEKSTYDLVLDFCTENDLIRFKERMELQMHSSASMILIRGCKSTKHLQQDCRYSLNMDVLAQYERIMANEEVMSPVIFAEYRSFESLDSTSLFLSYSPQSVDMVFHPSEVVNDTVSLPNFDSEKPLKIRVNNVGQGNWNELWCGDKVSLVYDIGATMNARNTDLRVLMDNRMKDYEESKPAFMLSHWDLDHYIVLKFALQKLAPVMSCFIYPDKYRGVTASRVLEQLSNFGVPLIPQEGFDRSFTGIIKRTNVFTKMPGAVFIGGKDNNRNNGGLIIIVEGKSRIGLLTGDSLLIQASDAASQYGVEKDNALVVPHHCGKTELKNRYYSPLSTCVWAAISVGAVNSYGHPDTQTLNYLKNVISESRINFTSKIGNPFASYSFLECGL